MYRSFICGIVTSALGLASVIPVNGDPLCHPKLTVTDVLFSEMIPPTLDRKWTAIVSVDASRCQPNSSGYFEIVFTRLSENGPDLDFRERFAWQPPSVNAAVDFAANEAVQRNRIDNITPCSCGG
jgi:hypothetical protein